METQTRPGTETPQAQFTGRIEEELERLRRDFLDLELEQMRKGEIAARAKLERAKSVVKEKRVEVEDKLDTAKKVGAAAWREARDGLQAAWDDLEGAVGRAREELRGEGHAGEEEG